MPMQRLTRYSLLLKAVYKNTENEDQRAELIHMVKFMLYFFSISGLVVHDRKECEAKVTRS